MTKRILLPLLVVLLACAEEPPAPAPAPKPKPVPAPVRTDRTHYTLRTGPYGPQATIVTTLHAPADRTLYLINCNGALTHGLQRLEGNQWVTAWIAETNGCFSAPIVVRPGESYVATMTPISRPETWTIPSGTYRAVWHNVLTSFDMRARPMGEELPLEQRVSAPFTLEVPASR